MISIVILVLTSIFETPKGSRQQFAARSQSAIEIASSVKLRRPRHRLGFLRVNRLSFGPIFGLSFNALCRNFRLRRNHIN